LDSNPAELSSDHRHFLPHGPAQPRPAISQVKHPHRLPSYSRQQHGVHDSSLIAGPSRIRSNDQIRYDEVDEEDGMEEYEYDDQFNYD
jgi:hypothetical protein